jgi:hypothetical protein
MVKVIKKGGKVLSECEQCGFRYMDKSSAEECEKWCSDHHNCNLKITKKAVGNKPMRIDEN